MFIRINPYLCHLLTRYQSTIFPNHKSCVRKKGVPTRSVIFLCSEGVGRWRFSDKGGAEGGCGSFRRRCFSGKSPLSDGLEDRVGKNAFSSVLRVVFSSPVFSYFCIFFLYSSARCSGRIRSSCLRAKPFRICPAFCLPNYELTPISESMCESPFRCRCVVAEDAGFARKRVDYMIDVIRKTPSVRNPNRRGIK